MQETNKNEKDLLSIGLLFFFCKKSGQKNKSVRSLKVD